MPKEHQQMEWKASWRDEYMKWICGFANAEGGRLVVGKDDKGRALGVPDADRLMQDLPNKIRDLLGIMPAVRLKKSAGKRTVEIAVDAYPHPVSYHGRYYQRSGSTNQEIKGAALDRFLLGKQGKPWDGVPVPHLKVSQLSRRVLADFRKRATDSKRMRPADLKVGDATLIDKLKLREGRYLKRAAALLFHSDPEDFVTGAYIKIGFFAGPGDIRFQDEVHGDLFTQKEAISYDLIHVCAKRPGENSAKARSWAAVRQEIRKRARVEIEAIGSGRYGKEPLPVRPRRRRNYPSIASLDHPRRRSSTASPTSAWASV